MMCKALLIRSLDRAQSLATCFCSGSCPMGISVSTCSGNSYTIHSFGLFCKTDSIWSLVNLCTNHCQVPLATFLECKESFPSLSLSSFLLFPPSPWYIINPSTHITLLGIIAFLTFSYKQWAPTSWGCATGLWLQGTTRDSKVQHLVSGFPRSMARGSVPALLQLQPVTHLCVTPRQWQPFSGFRTNTKYSFSLRMLPWVTWIQFCTFAHPHSEPSAQVQDLLSSEELRGCINIMENTPQGLSCDWRVVGHLIALEYFSDAN